MTKRGGRDVTLLKRSLAQPLANRSCCFAQAVGCCKNVCYFCRTQRRSAGSSDSIRGVTEKRRKGYPWGPVGNTGGILSSLQEGQSDDWALQSWSTEHWRWPPQRSSTSSSVWRKRGRSGSSSNEWTSMSVRNVTAEVQIYDAPAETILFWHINMLCVHLKTNAQMSNPDQGQICTETSSGVLIRPRRFSYSIFAPGRNTGSSLGPWEQERVAPVEPPCATIAQEEKVVKSAGKVMVTVFWDTERLLRVDFLDYGVNMNWEYRVIVNECYKNKQVTCNKYQQLFVVTCLDLLSMSGHLLLIPFWPQFYYSSVLRIYLPWSQFFHFRFALPLLKDQTKWVILKYESLTCPKD